MITYQPFFHRLALIAGVMLGFSIPISNVLTNICVILLFLAWLFSGVKPKLQMLFKSKSTFFILALLAVYVIGIIYSPAEMTEIKSMLRKMSRLLLIPIIMSIFVELKWRKYALYSFWLAMVFSLLIIIIQITNVLFLGTLWKDLICKFHSLPFDPTTFNDNLAFKDRIFTSLLFSFAFFSLLHYSVDNFIKSIRFCHGNCSKYFAVYNLPNKNIFSLLVVISFLIYLFIYCEGRSGQIIAIGLLGIFLLQKKYSWRKILLCNVILILTVYSVYKIQINCEVKNRYYSTYVEVKEYCKTNFANKWIIPDILKYFNINIDSNINNMIILPSIGHQSTGLRLEFLTNSLRLIKSSPFIGYGTGSFGYIYNEKNPLFDVDHKQLTVHNPHNQYILTTVELGLVGLLALLGMLGVMLYECSFLPSLERYLAQGVIFTIVVGCLANSWLMDFTSMHYFAYFMGICFAAMPKKSDNIPIQSL